MNKLLGLTKRNLLVYFKDKSSVFFSVLTPIIIFALYILFLKDTYVSQIQDSAKGLEAFIDVSDIENLTASLLLAGILGSALITIPFQALTTIVKDKEYKVDYDISATPISRVNIILSYFFAAAISSFIMVLGVTLTGCMAIKAGGYDISVDSVLKLIPVIALGSVSSSALFMIIMMFFKSTGASSAFMGILSAAAGFVIGAYIPLSNFSSGVESVCTMFPATQVTSLIKKTLLTDNLSLIDAKIGGVDNGLFVQSMEKAFSVNPYFDGKAIDPGQSVIYVLAVFLVSVAAISLIYPRVYKRK